MKVYIQAMSLQSPLACVRLRFSTRDVLKFRNVYRHLGPRTVQAIKVPLSHSDYPLSPVVMEDLSCGIIFIRTLSSVLDLGLMGQLAKLCTIHRNVAKLVYRSAKVIQ